MKEQLWVRGKMLVLQEWKTALRFLVVGGSSFLVKAGAYVLISRALWPEGPRTFQNVLAIVVSVMYNYTLHLLWTFRIHRPAPGSFPRYLAVVIGASLADIGLFYVLHVQAGLYDLAAFVINGISIASFTFILHRLFTFRTHPDTPSQKR